jgi:hypothetical protein
MKNTNKLIIALVAVFFFSSVICFSQNVNNTDELKKYLDSQPANSPDKPINITINADASMFPKIAEILNSTGKYVSLNLTGNSLKTIPNKAFYDETYKICQTLVSITIPNSVISIGEEAFAVCVNLTSVNIPNSVTSIGNSAFAGCGFTNVNIPNSVTSIGRLAFYRCAKLVSITIPDSVTSIGNNAFAYCGLTNVTIPNKVTSIGENTFSGCDRLTSVTIPNSVISIGNNAFSSCGLTDVTIPNSVTSIGNNAFASCKSLASITIGSGITDMNWISLNDYNNLTSINVDEKNTTYSSNNGILYNKNKTVLIKYPEKKTGSSFSIPASVTHISSSAFAGSELSSIIIPDSVTSIGNNAFLRTAWLNNQPNGVVYIGKIAYTYKGTMSANTSITLLDDTKGIAEGAFYKYTSLTSVTIPNRVTSIGNFAFRDTNLSSVTIPDSVTSIGNNAFRDTNLSSVTFQGKIASNNINKNVFDGDLRDKYLAGGIGTYTTTAPVKNNSKWTKQ